MVATKPQSSAMPNLTIASNESATTEISQRSSDGSHKPMVIAADSKPVLIPANYPQKRLALVIGNAEYQLPGVSLANATHDAEDTSNMLMQLGFDVSLHLNQTKQGMEQAIQAFAQKLKNAGNGTVALFYYAGHASEVEGVNYMFPVEVQLKGEELIDKEAVAVQGVVDQLHGC